MCVLIVEDEPVIALHAALVLSGMGFGDVRCVGDLSRALELLEEHDPVLAILDVNVGDSLVFPLAEALRERAIPIVFSSVQSRSDMPREWADRPFAAKPIEHSAIAGILKQLKLSVAQIS